MLNWDNQELIKRARSMAKGHSQDTLYRITTNEHDWLRQEIFLAHNLDINELWQEYWLMTDKGPESSSRKGITARFNYFWDCMRALTIMR